MRRVVYDIVAPNIRFCVDAAWIAVGIVWLVGAINTKRTARAETSASRLVQFLLVSAAFGLLFNQRIPFGPLDRRFIGDSALVECIGLALTLAGTGFAIWARVFLGRNWSSNVTIKQDHQMIRNGPYAVVRHPIYAGFLLAILGTALVSGEIRALIALGLAFLSWWMKSRLEERFMEQQFGAEYSAYKRRVKALIPFVL